MSDDSSDWVGRTLSGGRYRVDAKLGEGGMGFVYKVWDRNLDAEVVVKAPRRSMVDDPEFARRFALEIRSLVKLSHPQIVKVSDVGEHEGLPFAVMQYLSGGTLDERLDYGREGRPLPASPGSLASWLPGMAAALDFIHGKGYIHRDVKPANILFDAHGHAYLSDFGVAKVLSDVEATAGKRAPSGRTGIGIVLGTPEYMAPELIMGDAFDGRVDQYALAATAYEILCGRKPFTGETATAILVRQTTQDAPPMGELPEPAAPAIARVVFKGLAKKPAERYANCTAFAAALVAALARAGAAKAPADRQVCPTCGVGFAMPEGLEHLKGKRSKCRACGAPFRITQDGRSLVRVDPAGAESPSGSVEIPFSDHQPSAAASATARANRTTMKLDARPGPDSPGPAPAAPDRSNRTVKMEAPGPLANRTVKIESLQDSGGYPIDPRRANRTMKLEAIPGPAGSGGPMAVDDLTDDEPAHHSPWPWVIAGGGVVAALLLGVVLALRPSANPPTELPPIQLATALKPGASAPTLRIPKSEGPAKPPGTTPPTPGPSNPAPPKGPGFRPPAPPVDVPPPITTPPQVAEPPAGDVSGAPDLAGKPEAPPADEGPAEPPKAAPKDGQVVANLTLAQIVANPEGHVGEVVSPADPIHVSTDLEDRQGPRRGLKVRGHEGAYQDLVKDVPFQVVLARELAGELRRKLNDDSLALGEYPALLKMRIVKDQEGPGYLGVVEWIEFLHYIDPRPIAGKLHIYTYVYCVVHLDASRVGTGHSPDYKLWQKRYQIKTTNVRNAYVNANRPPIYEAWAKQAANPAGHGQFFHHWILEHVK